MKKIRYFMQEQRVFNSNDAETINQLERILAIRKNRRERLASQARELRQNLAERDNELREQIANANQFKQKSTDIIASLRKETTKSTMSVNDIFGWQHREVCLQNQIEKSFERCHEIQVQKDSEAKILDEHMQVYQQAIIDAEKISLIKDEVEERQRKNS